MVAKVEFHFGELCPRVGFIVTNFQTSNRAVVRFCDQRATAEHLRRAWRQSGPGGKDVTTIIANPPADQTLPMKRRCDRRFGIAGVATNDWSRQENEHGDLAPPFQDCLTRQCQENVCQFGRTNPIRS